MAVKRTAPRAVSTTSSPGPLVTALCLGVALSCGVGTLVSRGMIQWPLTQLLSSLTLIAGCLALAGPILLSRKAAHEVGVGELIWMAGGLIISVYDAAAFALGETRSMTWATPLNDRSMGLTIFAITLATWRSRVGGSKWVWTNVTGWTLGVFWVLMAARTLLPAKMLGLFLR